MATHNALTFPKPYFQPFCITYNSLGTLLLSENPDGKHSCLDVTPTSSNT